MARLFRFVEKKRGGRRTGSNLVGNFGEALFFGSLFLVGMLALSVLLASHLLAPDPASFTIGFGKWLFLLLMASFVLLGGGGMIWTVLRIGVSAERRSALATRAVDLDLMQEAVPRPRNYPAIPPFDGLVNSPGIDLAYRLPPAQTPGWQLLAMTIFGLLWTGVVCFFTVWTISNALAGRPEWLLTALLVPFWAVCYWAIREFLQLLVVNSGTGSTTVEISDLPLAPGHEYQVAIAQHGQLTMKSLELWLVCEEEATFTQGTDIRSEVREVWRQLCFERRDFRIEAGVPFQEQCAIAVPPTAMHSFYSPHNAVRWKLVARGEADGWPAFERGFPLVVYPGEATQQVEVAGHVARAALTPPHVPLPAAGVRA
ncbi:MAG TPA: hypothetical protein VFB80_15820 [Pirellulaceae bacterium]|nr:hypothetical protein [Pirellulaceae bacterium]